MNPTLTLVTAGLPDLAAALERSGRFISVHHADTLAGFRSMTKTALAGLRKDEVLFAFSDTLVEDAPGFSLDRLLSQLSGSGWRVLIVGGPNGRDVAARHPGAGLIDGMVTVNLVLGALSSFPGVRLDPVADGDAPVGAPLPPAPAWVNAPAPAVDPPAPAPTSSGPVFAPFAEPAPAVTGPEPRPVFAPIVTPSPEPAPAAGLRPPSSGLRAPLRAPGGTTGAPAATEAPAAPQSPFGPLTEPPSTPFAAQPIRPRGAAPLHVAEQQVRRRGFVIMVGAPKGGTGKSTLSLTLAVTLGLRLKAAGRTVALMDCNIQQSDAGLYLGGSHSPTVMELARDQSLITPEKVNQGLQHRRDLNLSVLLGPNSSVDANPAYLNSDLYGRILEAMRFNFDYLVLDTPVSERYLDIVSGFAVPQADFILVPAIPSFQALVNINRWLTETVSAPRSVGGLGVPYQKIGVVLNRAEDDISCGEEEVKQELGSWQYLGAIPESKEWKKANNEHRLIAMANLHDLNEALVHILNQVTGQVEPLLAPANADANKPGRLAQLRNILSRGR